MDIEPILDALQRATDARPDPSNVRPVTGGSINRAFRVATDRAPVFLKVNAAAAQPMFAAEAAGLAALAQAGALRVPEVLAAGATTTNAFLALEWIELAQPQADAERALGRGLARLHRRHASHFGWYRDNTIGSTPQFNAQSSDWTTFFGERRLRYQLELAQRKGLPMPVSRSLDRLLAELDTLIGGHAPEPSLLHGDLWAGNWGATRASVPVIFDPAVYFGDREADLAMTRLFGGFSRGFYAAYEAEWPLPQGWERRAVVYNLYHLLNHFNLFGSTYLASLRDSLQTLGYPC